MAATQTTILIDEGDALGAEVRQYHGIGGGAFTVISIQAALQSLSIHCTSPAQAVEIGERIAADARRLLFREVVVTEDGGLRVAGHRAGAEMVAAGQE